MQPLNLVAPPGQPYQFRQALTGFGVRPDAHARLSYAPGGRALPDALQPTCQVINDTSHPAAWRVLIALIMPTRPAWVELYVNKQCYASGWLKPQTS